MTNDNGSYFGASVNDYEPYGCNFFGAQLYLVENQPEFAIIWVWWTLAVRRNEQQKADLNPTLFSTVHSEQSRLYLSFHFLYIPLFLNHSTSLSSYHSSP